MSFSIRGFIHEPLLQTDDAPSFQSALRDRFLSYTQSTQRLAIYISLFGLVCLLLSPLLVPFGATDILGMIGTIFFVAGVSIWSNATLDRWFLSRSSL
jgi:hypothetical protein